MGEKQPDVYSAITHITDGIYHAIKIIRKYSIIELYVDGIKIKLEGGNSKLDKEKEELSKNIFIFRIYTYIRTTSFSWATTIKNWEF